MSINRGVCSSFDYFFDESMVIVEGNMRPFTVTVDVVEQSKDRYRIKVYLHSISPAPAPVFSVKVKFPRDKVNQLWNSQTWSNKSHFTLPSYDRSASSFAIISGLTLNDQNQITFTCRDRFDSRFISTSVQEEGDSLDFCLDLFEDNPPLTDLQEYEVELMVDLRNISFSDAIYDASKWRLEDKFAEGTASVDTTKVPVYSTWYPMNRNIPLENITRELDSLKTFNFKSILVDDGWQTLVKMKIDSVYEYDEQSFATMGTFSDKIKNLGLKYYMWYSLPFKGGNPLVSQKFEGKYIRYKAPRQLYVLDPRYADVRKHLISTYSSFIKEWGFDGFWFDFLKDFYQKNGTELNEDLGKDYLDLDLAVAELKKRMSARLMAVNPSVFLGQDFEAVGPNQNKEQDLLKVL